ncbi:homoserine kinase [Sideroxydans lithotrophicus]|uniref:Homoserine kinase n=1 Tax=Sideroxydans lithotrophicus (strain ES-1) TaxID=580332 RepID=D5CPR6_SIDLE|nr:homoserine kinase [Sideroxydans lithotrophicus]ADE13061.1 homoserine kinase [Sideroxydans lithotrophicus ES-1]
MAVFTRVSEADIAAWLSNYSLGTLIELQGIPAGIENTNYFVTTSNGRFVLTLFEKLTSDDLPFFLNLMAHLARHGIPCPCPVADKQNHFLGKLNDKPACIVSRLSGKSVTQPNTAQCAAVGAMLGQMHSAGQSFGDQMLNPRGSSWRAEAANKVKRFLPAQDAALLESEVALHAANPLNGLPRGIIHADLFRDNVLMDGEHVGGLIDFYFACTGNLLYDVAITVNDWCMTPEGKLDATHTRAMLNAYHAARPFTAREAEAWPMALRVAALRFWISRLYDLYLPREGEMVHPHNPEQFKRILQNHIATPQPAWL